MLTLIAAALTLAAPAERERTDLLAFDQGTMLVSSPASFGTGVARWSVWGLADGDPKNGWCSAKDKPAPAAFVFELEGAAELTAVALDTTDVQAGYKGISAKTVELWVASEPGEPAFARVATFELPERTRKELALPKGARGRWLKFVVTANWGNAQYTELMELNVYGTPLAAPQSVDLSGDYKTQFQAMRLVQVGDRLFGCYDHDQGVIEGGVTGRVAKVTWRELNGDGTTQLGTAIFQLTADQGFKGVWFEKGALRGEWNGERVPRAKGPKCTPPAGGALGATLKSAGHVVLYGIRFDSNSDVPRADSEPTLKELLAAMKADASLRLRIEGHTDATNTDAYNQELSQRRARAVVAWLTSAGIDGARVEAKGLGRTQPVADNASAQGRALNRRVEVWAIK